MTPSAHEGYLMKHELRGAIILSHCVARLQESGAIDLAGLMSGTKDMATAVNMDDLKSRATKIVYTHNLMVVEAILFIVRMEQLEIDPELVLQNAVTRKSPHKLLRRFINTCTKKEGDWKYSHPHTVRYLTILDSLADPKVKL